MFQLDKILVEENLNLSRPIQDINVIESSFFNMTLMGITEYKQELRDGTKIFYTALSESNGDSGIIHEAFSNFFNKIIEMIKKFLKLIQKLFDKFVITINKLIKSEKYLKKHKQDFSRFTSDHEFEYQGYNFTFSNGIPVVDPMVDLLPEDKFNFTKLDKGFITADEKEYSTKLTAYKNSLSDYIGDGFGDQFRAYVIGSETPISSSDFSNELFCVYRNGDSETTSLTIDKSFIDRSYDFVDKYNKLIKDVKDKKNDIESKYKKLKTEIERYAKSFSDSDYGEFISKYIDNKSTSLSAPSFLSDTDKTTIELIIKARADQIASEMDIHGMAFAAKLDAIKDCYKQDKTILYKALYKIGLRESGVVDIEDVDDDDLVVIEDEDDQITQITGIPLENFRFNESGELEVVDDEGEAVSIEGDFDALDLVHPTEELINAIEASGILQISDGEDDAFSSELFPSALRICSDELPNGDNINYDLFLASEAMNDAEVYMTIQENMLMASGKYTTESMQIIQENFVDTIKSIGTKIWNAIVTIFNKFVQTLEELFKTDKGYLEKYKDIILKRQVKIEVDCWAYFDEGHGSKIAISNEFNNISTSLITDTGVFDVTYFNKREKDDAIKDRNKYLASISNGTVKINNVDEFQEAIMGILKGEETSYDAKTLQDNMVAMYEFCYNYKNYKDSAKKVLDKIEKNLKKMEDEATKLSKTAPSNEDNTTTETKTESAFVQEIDIRTTDNTDNKGTNDSTTTSGNNSSAYKTTIDKDKMGKEGDVEKLSDENKKLLGKETTKEDFENFKEALKDSLSFYSSIVGAKLSFGQICYKDYMKIIRAHVRTYQSKESNDDPNTKKDKGTNKDIETNNQPKKEEKIQPAQ